MTKYPLLLAFLLCPPVLADDVPADENAVDTPLQAETVIGPDWSLPPYCEGDGCDAYLPAVAFSQQYRDRRAERRWDAALGGLSGALIGEEIGGVAGAVGLGALGAALGYHTDRDSWERQEEARRYDAAWQRGDDIYYNPAHTLPWNPHYFRGAKSK
ncbi:MAG: hypothetical protein EP335_05865 [Alphaproteobacteria bacterium]|nr:MAG: hypothetical protein EP335_05865 [Alphaproteobacteria bacterium]